MSPPDCSGPSEARHDAAARDATRIVAGHPVLYSLTNGLTWTEYGDGESYEVPPFVADDMIAHGLAEIVHPPVVEAEK